MGFLKDLATVNKMGKEIQRTTDVSARLAHAQVAMAQANATMTVMTASTVDIGLGPAIISHLEQAEVADRLCAPPGSRVYGAPSVKLAWYATARPAGTVPRTVVVTADDEPLIGAIDEGALSAEYDADRKGQG